MVNVFVFVWPETALTYRVRVYELASPSEFNIGALVRGSSSTCIEPLDVKSISPVVSKSICESTFEAICNPLSIDDCYF